MRLRKANANETIDDLARTVKRKANTAIDSVHEVAAAATLKARHGVHNTGEAIMHTGERIAGAGEKITHAGEKIMKMAK